MPDLSSSIQFTVRFDLTSTPRLVLTDTTVSLPTGTVGKFDIAQPNGLTRNGLYTDIETSGDAFNFPLSASTSLPWQIGAYSVVYTLKTSDDTTTTQTKTFDFDFEGISLAIQENFDTLTPTLNYSDITDYGLPNWLQPTIVRSWIGTSAATGNLASASSVFDLIYSDHYYSSQYAISLDTTVTYVSSAHSYLSVSYESSISTLSSRAFTPPSLLLLLQWLTAFRLFLNTALNVDTIKSYAYASGLYAELRSIICNGGYDNLLLSQYYASTHRGASLVGRITNLPIPPYDLTTCFYTPTGNTFAISAQPQSQNVNVGTSYSLGVTVVYGTAPFTYVLKRDGTAFGSPITQNGRTVSTSMTESTAGSHSWTFVITDSLGLVLTSNAAVIVATAAGMVITTQPTNQNITLGQPFTIMVAFSGGTPNFTYILKRNGANYGSPITQSARSLSTSDTPSAVGTETYQFVITDSLANTVSSNIISVIISASSNVTGYFVQSDAPVTLESQILAGTPITFTHNADVTVPFTADADHPKYLQYFEPTTETIKTHVYVNSINEFDIAPDNYYEDTTTIGAFTAYIPVYPSSFAPDSPIFKKTA